jgi:AcrR family transcriptional regulator
MGKADATRERILEAAMAEFSAYGVAGARVDRIAGNAGCNKNLIYVYFENKETLFTTVLEKHLLRVYEDLDFTPDDLPGYAGRVFDYTMAHTDLMRLMAWSNLEQKAADSATRAQVHGGKVAELADAQADGKVNPAFPPAFILTTVMTLATAWTAVNPYGTSLDPDAPKDPHTLRKHIVELVSQLARLE